MSLATTSACGGQRRLSRSRTYISRGVQIRPHPGPAADIEGVGHAQHVCARISFQQEYAPRGHLGRIVLLANVLQGHVVRQGRVLCGCGQRHGLQNMFERAISFDRDLFACSQDLHNRRYPAGWRSVVGDPPGRRFCLCAHVQACRSRSLC